jgi:hypothetical protein
VTANSVHALLHLAVTMIASFDRVGGGWQQLVIEKGQRLVQGRWEHLVQGVANPLEPLDPLTQFVELIQSGWRAATPIKQRINLLHDLTQFAQLGQAPCDMQKLLALAGLETPFDKQETSLEQPTDLLLNGFALAGQAARRLILGRRSTALQFGLGVGQSGAFGRDGAQGTLGEFLEEGVIAPFPRLYAANGCCWAALAVSTQMTGSGFEAK